MSESNAAPARVLASRGTAPGSERWSLLVMRIATADSSALSDFYDQAHRYVHAIALRILRDPDEAEEITLDVFQQVWRLAPSYNPERCAVTSWIGMMTRSRSLDRWRSMRSRRRLLAPEIPEGVEFVSNEAGPDSQLSAAEDQQRLRKAMAILPEEQRSMISLAFWDGLSHSEVATRTGLPLGTVKTRIRLGMLKLREELERANSAR